MIRFLQRGVWVTKKNLIFKYKGENLRPLDWKSYIWKNLSALLKLTFYLNKKKKKTFCKSVFIRLFSSSHICQIPKIFYFRIEVLVHNINTCKIFVLISLLTAYYFAQLSIMYTHTKKSPDHHICIMNRTLSLKWLKN